MVNFAPAAFAIETEAKWEPATRFANRLLRSQRRVLLVTGGIPEGNNTLAPGSFVIPVTPVFDPGLPAPVEVDTLRAEAEEAGVELVPLDGSSGLLATPLAPMHVGLYGGGGAPFNHAAVLAACGFSLRFVSDADILGGALNTVDALVVPGGGFRAMHGQIEPLGEDGTRAIAKFVRQGGMYVGSCAGAYDCAVTSEVFIQSCPAQRSLQLINARVWNGEDGELGGLQSPGVGVLRVRTTRPDHPVMFGMPSVFDLTHYNGPVFELLDTPVVHGASFAAGLAAFDGWTERFTSAEAFMGGANGTETLLQRATAAGLFSVVAGELGMGRVVAFGSHPEFGFDLPMHDWSAPARMLVNAILWQAMHRCPGTSTPWSYRSVPGPVSLPRGAALDAVAPLASAVTNRAAALRGRSIEPHPRWLRPDYALSVFGATPDEIWTRSLVDMSSLADEASRLTASLRDILSDYGDAVLPQPVAEAVLQIDRWVLDERPPEWRQDGGYQGVLALLRTAIRMCDEALARWDVNLGPPAGPYAYVDTNPYHLVAGSYLAAVGCVVGAVQLLRALVAEVAMAQRLAAVGPKQLLAAGR